MELLATIILAVILCLGIGALSLVAMIVIYSMLADVPKDKAEDKE